MIRITVSKLDELEAFLSENISKGMLWAKVQYIYMTLRKKCTHCFKTKEEARLFKPATSFRNAPPIIVPLIPFHRVVSWLNRHEKNREIRIEGVFIDLEKICNNWMQQQKELITKKIDFMNEQNFQYLKDNIKYLGFGENLNEALTNKLKEGLSEFSITHKTEINRKPFEAALHFRKSDNSDMYFLNSYSASLQRSNGEKKDQTFYLNNGKGVTAKEAYNLLEGRAVFKELTNKNGEKYHAWLQIDFDNKDKRNNHEMNQYHEKYGYDLKTAVSKFAVAELKDPEKGKNLLQSLQRGNVQSITIEKDGSAHKMFIEANPQFKTVNLYDANMKRVQKENIGTFQSIRPTTETVKNEEKRVEPENKKEGKKNEIKQNSDSLLPKKRERQKKGLHI